MTLPYPTTDFTGETIIVTGSNTGLGQEAAQHFVALGAAKVILACRSIEKGESAKSKIEKVTKKRGTGELEGRESTVTVNVISTFLLSLLLLPKLRADAVKYNITPRLAIVASEAHEQAAFVEQSAPSIFAALNDPMNQQDKYNLSKLLEVLIVRELAPAMTASGKPRVTLNCLTPGFCHSELMRNAPFPLKTLATIAKFFLARTTEVGSRTLVSAAAAKEDTYGKYLANLQVKEPSKWVGSEKGAETQVRVYKELLEILEGIEPGITGNI
ncbi:related to enoyl-CoA hydratase/isomerase [Rhynchosporium secalis]|uniref:Related to enoyl-CoA hydratase/isomerase n=1 Tax=Rhynchosporium secalis TaxID=38038 RepID=A0A1E1MK83_RHYSE|nr:related to enoyl-CoA hydratase/isomerase [Rhynchosporium secalis]